MGSLNCSDNNDINEDEDKIMKLLPNSSNNQKFSEFLQDLMHYIKNDIDREDMQSKIEQLLFIMNYLQHLKDIFIENQIDDDFLNKEEIKNQFKLLVKCIIIDDLSNLYLETDKFISLIIMK